eukprot:NODE_210_length_12844_cov_1.045822.p11 type:complete len:132 gc:universal NODE_210_length_12844_cov_1.045822:6345-5950(-)
MLWISLLFGMHLLKTSTKALTELYNSKLDDINRLMRNKDNIPSIRDAYLHPNVMFNHLLTIFEINWKIMTSDDMASLKVDLDVLTTYYNEHINSLNINDRDRFESIQNLWKLMNKFTEYKFKPPNGYVINK